MKNIIRILLLGLFFSLIALGLISCGARKLNKESYKEESKVDIVDKSIIENQSELNVKTNAVVTVNDKNEVISTEETISPIDNTKEASIIGSDGKKIVLNNSKKTIKTETKKNNTQTSAVENKEESKSENSKQKNDIQKSEEKKVEKSVKNVDQKQFNWLSLWWVYLIIIVLVYLIWLKFIKK